MPRIETRKARARFKIARLMLEELEMKQFEIARALRVSQSTVSTWFNFKTWSEYCAWNNNKTKTETVWSRFVGVFR